MADQKKPPEAEAAPTEPKKGKGKLKTMLIIGGLMAVEGVGVFFLTKSLTGGPPGADAAMAEHGDDVHVDEHAGDGADAGHGGSAEKADGHGASKTDDHGAAKSDGHGNKSDGHGGKPDGHGGKSDGKGSEKAHSMPMPADALAEIELADCRLHNSRTGRMILVRIRVSALVAAGDHEKAKALVEAKKSRIQDRISSVIRSAEPKYLNEAGLETLKRNLRHELGQVMGDAEIIKQVLIPELLQT